MIDLSPGDQTVSMAIPGNAVQRCIVEGMLAHRSHVQAAGDPVVTVEYSAVGNNHDTLPGPMLSCDGIQGSLGSGKEDPQRFTAFGKREIGLPAAPAPVVFSVTRGFEFG